MAVVVEAADDGGRGSKDGQNFLFGGEFRVKKKLWKY